MSDKLNCYECKQWFEIKDLVYLPEERFYLCRPCGCMFYAKRSVLLRSELERYETARQEDARRLEQVKGERDELFNVAVKSFNAMFEIGVGLAPDELTPRVRALDHALANDLNDELWERINAAALKDAK